jgi:CDP-glycerol glycerophosphotransferase (TagB/SpsB family)
LWVFGSTIGREYCDNSRAVFEFVRAHRPDVRAVWLIDADSPDVADLDDDSWVDRRSIEAHRLTRAADVVVFSHGVADVAGLYSNRRGVVVRLGHGLTAFGLTRGKTAHSLRRMVRRVTVAPIASQFERQHKLEWGFTADQLPITGLARWDMLRAERGRADGDARDLFILAPTWRSWLTRGGLTESDYWRAVSSVVESETLRRLLRESGLRLALFVHPILRAQVADRVQRDDRVEFIRRGADLPAALARARLFMTDWSSIAFDALALRVPTLFWHFDVDRYLATRGSYVDLKQRLFGPTVETAHDIEAAVARFVRSGLKFPDFEADQAEWARRAFAYEDESNSARVVAEIERQLALRASA